METIKINLGVKPVERKFTAEDGIKVQSEHLAEWKQLLKSKVYKDLEKWATKYNHKAVSGYDVTRGTDLNNFIANYLNKYTPSQTLGN